MAKDRHHLIPRARCRELGINPNFPGNVVKVSVGKHRAWHQLFGSLLPEEAIELIRKEWSLSPEAEAEFKKLCGNVEPLRKRR